MTSKAIDQISKSLDSEPKHWDGQTTQAFLTYHIAKEDLVIEFSREFDDRQYHGDIRSAVAIIIVKCGVSKLQISLVI